MNPGRIFFVFVAAAAVAVAVVVVVIKYDVSVIYCWAIISVLEIYQHFGEVSSLHLRSLVDIFYSFGGFW